MSDSIDPTRSQPEADIAREQRVDRSSSTSVEKPAYEKPLIVSHSGEELLKELGPAQACYGFSGGGIGSD